MAYPYDFYEIDFLDVETDGSGDAITIRVGEAGVHTVSVTDGGYTDCGSKIIEHIAAHYDNAPNINHVVVTHPDGDHAAGLKYVLENATVQQLWMNRPWEYAQELIYRFPTYNSVQALRSKLRAAYPTLVELEEIANRKGIPIGAPLQGTKIGHFWVMAPSRARLLDLIVESDKTPEGARAETLGGILAEVLKAAVAFVKGAWAHEIFSVESTSRENEMSVIQFANIGGQTVLLTGDAGREALREAVDFAPMVGLALPGIDRFQVPHHGSRRNVSTELLDELLGQRLPHHDPAASRFTAIVSAAEKDQHHPRKAVVRAMIHRGGRVLSTENGDQCLKWQAPSRDGWGPATPLAYPEDQET